MTETEKCKKKFDAGEKKKKKRKRKSDVRIVDGEETKHPFPWMVSKRVGTHSIA